MNTIGTLVNEFTKLFAANTAAATITALVPTATEPTGNGVLDAMTNWAGANAAFLQFFGTRTAADDETLTAKVTGWRLMGTLWVPVPLLALALTQGTSVGVASQPVVATEYFADTVTASTAFTSAYELISPADNTIAGVKVDFFGCRKLQVQLAKGTNATCNCLAAVF
jgi:hypothetical protein